MSDLCRGFFFCTKGIGGEQIAVAVVTYSLCADSPPPSLGGEKEACWLAQNFEKPFPFSYFLSRSVRVYLSRDIKINSAEAQTPPPRSPNVAAINAQSSPPPPPPRSVLCSSPKIFMEEYCVPFQWNRGNLGKLSNYVAETSREKFYPPPC